MHTYITYNFNIFINWTVISIGQNKEKIKDRINKITTKKKIQIKNHPNLENVFVVMFYYQNNKKSI